MKNFLEPILENKRREVMQLLREKSLCEQLILNPGMIIAEVKRRSPALGEFREIRLEDQIQDYVQGGARAISILTDEKYFHGSMNDLRLAVDCLKKTNLPVIRKDFIIDERQLIEAKSAGADVVLLIAMVLQENLSRFIDRAHQIGLEALVEIYNEAELNLAVKSGAQMIAVNNRNLRDFTVDLDVSRRLIDQIPQEIPAVSASGFETREQIVEFTQRGFRGFLIGSALMKSECAATSLRAMRSNPGDSE